VAVTIVPADHLLQAQEDSPADLVVVGCLEARGYASRVSSPGHVLGRIRCRMAIVPMARAHEQIQRIVVGVDGSGPSLRALRWSAHIAHALDAEVLAVYATGPLIEWVSETSPSSWRHVADRQLDDWIAAAINVEVLVDRDLVENIRPGAALASAVEGSRAGLAVAVAGAQADWRTRPLASYTRTPVVIVP
jgi:nucleotide-binding universal stress UspA family protein